MMKRNILKENMRRFGTKNLKEQSIINGDTIRVIGRPSIDDPSTSAGGQRLYFNVDASLADINDMIKGGSKVIPSGTLAGETYLSGRWAIINQDGKNVLPQSKQLMMFYDTKRHKIYCHIEAGAMSHSLKVMSIGGRGDSLRAFQVTAREAHKLMRMDGLAIKTLNPVAQHDVDPDSGISYGADDNPADNQPTSPRYGSSQ